MKLTPLDIRKHEFARKVRGYDPDEVKAFTDMVSRQWEEVLDELRHARDRVRELEGRIGHYEKVEGALHEALESARSGAKRTQEQAEARAQLIVEEAELKAEQRLREAEQQQSQLRQDVGSLSRRHDEVVARLRHFLMSELEILARHEDDRPVGFMQLMPSSPAEALPPSPQEGAPEAVPPPSSLPSVPAPPAGPTTYGDLYDRAVEADREATDRASERAAAREAEDFDEEEPTWTLRSIVGAHEDEAEEDDSEDEDASTAPDAEKERIRRILEDLD